MKINVKPLTDKEKLKRIVKVEVTIQPEDLINHHIKTLRHMWKLLRKEGVDIRNAYIFIRDNKKIATDLYEIA